MMASPFVCLYSLQLQAEPVVSLTFGINLGNAFHFVQPPLVDKTKWFHSGRMESTNGRSELKAISVKRLVIKGRVGAGAIIEMQYNSEIWNKKNFLSL